MWSNESSRASLDNGVYMPMWPEICGNSNSPSVGNTNGACNMLQDSHNTMLYSVMNSYYVVMDPYNMYPTSTVAQPKMSYSQIRRMLKAIMPRTKRLNSQPVKCETCGITLNSEVQAQQHFSGKQHLKKLKGGISGSESPPKTDKSSQNKGSKTQSQEKATDKDELTNVSENISATETSQTESKSTEKGEDKKMPNPEGAKPSTTPVSKPRDPRRDPRLERRRNDLKKASGASSGVGFGNMNGVLYRDGPEHSSCPPSLLAPSATPTQPSLGYLSDPFLPAQADSPYGPMTPPQTLPISGTLHNHSGAGSAIVSVPNTTMMTAYASYPSGLLTTAPEYASMLSSSVTSSNMYNSTGIGPSVVPNGALCFANPSAMQYMNGPSSLGNLQPTNCYPNGSLLTQPVLPQTSISIPGGAAALSQGEATGVVTGMPSNVPQGGATAVPSGGASAQQPSGSSGYTQHAQKDKSKLDPVSQAVYDNMLGKLPLKRKMEITCAVCETVFNSEVQADAHFKGGKHLKRLKMVEEMRKSLGGVTPSEAVKIQMETEEPAEKKANVGGGFFCNFCNIKVNSLEQLEAHRAGMAHRKVLERQAASQTKIHTTEIPGKQSGMFYCQICDISVPNAVGLKKHMSTLAHQDKQAGRQPKPDGPDNGAASATVAQPSSY